MNNDQLGLAPEYLADGQMAYKATIVASWPARNQARFRTLLYTGEQLEQAVAAERAMVDAAYVHAAKVRRSRLVTLEEAVRTVVERHGGIRAAERATGVDKSFISRLMRGQKVAPSAETLEALGLRAVPLYEVLKTPNAKFTGPRVGHWSSNERD